MNPLLKQSTFAKAFCAFDKSKFAAKPTVHSSKVLAEENKTNLAYRQKEPQRVDSYSIAEGKRLPGHVIQEALIAFADCS